MLEKRRYKLIDGRLHKRWDATDEPGWFKTKAEALKGRPDIPFGDWKPDLPPSEVNESLRATERMIEQHMAKSKSSEVHTVKRRPGRPRKHV